MEAPDRYNISAAHKNLIDIIYPQTSHFFTTPKPGNFGNFHDHLLRGFPELHSIRSSSGKQIKEQVSWPCWVQQVFFRARSDNPNKAEREWAIAEQEKWSPLQKQSVQVILEAYPLSSLKHNPPEYNSLPSQQTSAQTAKPQDSTQDAIIHRVESGRVVKRAVGERQSIPKIKEEENEEDDDGENMLANIPPAPRTRTRTRPRSSPYPYPHPRVARQTPRPSSTSTHTRTPRLPRLTPPTRPRPTREQRFLRHLDSLQNHLQTSNTFLTTLGQSADQREKQLKHELRNLERHRLEIVEQRRRFVNLECEVLRVKERFRELYDDLDVDHGGIKEEEGGSETEEDLYESDEEHGEWGSEIVGRRRSIRPEERDREPEDGDETEKDEDYDDYETDEDSNDDYDNDDDHYDDDSNNNNNLNNHNNNDNNLVERGNTTPPTSSPPPPASSPPPPPIPRNIVAADFF